MAWKNFKQLSLADSLTSEHEALTKLDGINELIDWVAIEYLLVDIHAKRRGNCALPPVLLLAFMISQRVFGLFVQRSQIVHAFSKLQIRLALK